MKRAATYARISTAEGRQHLENQIETCANFVASLAAPPRAPSLPGGWARADIYTDIESGAEPERPGLALMFQDAAARRFDILVVFDLSRLTREGPARAFEYIQKLHSYGCEFWSVNEAHFRTAGVAGDLLIAIAAYFASEERRAIRERVKAGLERARGRGVVLGRPTEQVDPAILQRLRKEGFSIRQIAERLDCSKSTIERRLKL